MYDDGSAHGTYLEDFVLSLEMLPNQFRRDLELLKELDRETYDLSKETQQLEKQYIDNLSKFSSLQDKLEKEKIIEVNQKIKNDINVLKDRIQKKLSNKSAIAQSLIDVIDQFGNKLDSDLVLFENELKGAGDYEAPRGIPSDSEIAFKITLDPNDQTLILGQVVSYRSESNMYEILDIDDRQKYTLPESQVLALGQADVFKKLAKGENIYALYPDTTIFYPAVIVQAPKRSALSSESIVTVQFHGDEDENGQTPNRTVPLKYIVRA